MRKQLASISIFFVLAVVTTIVIHRAQFIAFLHRMEAENLAAVAALITLPFKYSFSVDGILHEIDSSSLSSSPYFWLNSGGQMILKSGSGMTMQGDAPALNKWRILYAKSNPTDTDNGLHPQNVFRMLTRSTWENYRQQIYFTIKKNQLSSSSNRNESNGLLLMSRYKDSSNLYYAGVRVDGKAIIKKKINNVYYTLASKTFIANPGGYNRDTNSNVLPLTTAIGLRSETRTLTDGTVSIKLYTDNGKTGNWTLAAEAIDDGKKYGSVISGKQSAGIRTDFMDVEFDEYSLEEVK